MDYVWELDYLKTMPTLHALFSFLTEVIGKTNHFMMLFLLELLLLMILGT